MNKYILLLCSSLFHYRCHVLRTVAVVVRVYHQARKCNVQVVILSLAFGLNVRSTGRNRGALALAALWEDDAQ
jgi:hypothetical protein